MSLSVETQKLLVQPGREVSITQQKTFDEELESVEKIPDVNRRDQLIAIAILSAASHTQSLAAVIQAVDRISDSNLRIRLLEWIYFRRAAAAVKNKQFEEPKDLLLELKGKSNALIFTLRSVDPCAGRCMFTADAATA